MSQESTTSTAETFYPHREIEARWQRLWQERQAFATPERSAGADKYYVLEMFPYPSGRLHMGHCRVYSIGDAIARFLRMKGKSVLHPMGFDAFGLPAENAAIKNQIHPAEWTEQCIADMKEQFGRMGFSLDWNREAVTCRPDYYRWNQWFFLKMLERGLAYKKAAAINWCETCGTVLANEQVEQGNCWRCDNPVSIRNLEQWFFKITDYAEQLLADLEKLKDWPESVRIMQRNWIGRSEGALVKFKLLPLDTVLRAGDTADGVQTASLPDIEIFTTRPDTLYGVTYMVFAPEHPRMNELISGTSHEADVRKFISEAVLEDRFKRTAADKEKEGVFTGRYAINQLNNTVVPIYSANFVLMEYGTGAIMAVPAHDQRDFEFARKYEVPIKVVIQPEGTTLQPQEMKAAYVEPGILVNSGQFDGSPSEPAKKDIISYLDQQGFGARTIQYKLRDWLVSRQRFWGTPIPVIYCDKCGMLPVPEDQLPLELPRNVQFTGKGNPLATSDFVKATCHKCGGAARRETDTMDTFVDSSWYFLRYCDPQNSGAPFSREEADHWMPVDQYIGGTDHAILHLLYARFFTKVMRDLGLVSFDEPFTRMLGNGMVTNTYIDKQTGKNAVDSSGRLIYSKMSKSLGNGVDPLEIVDRYGADTARLYILFAAPAEKELEWTDEAVNGCYKFLNRVWRLVNGTTDACAVAPSLATELNPGNPNDRELAYEISKAIQRVGVEMGERHHFNTSIAAIMELSNAIHSYLSSAHEIERMTVGFGVRALILMLYPFAPHVASELWERAGFEGGIDQQTFPEHDPAALVKSEIEIVLQVNGKIRSKLVIATDATEEQVRAIALADEKVQSHLQGREPKKVIVVPGKLVNVVG